MEGKATVNENLRQSRNVVETNAKKAISYCEGSVKATEHGANALVKAAQKACEKSMKGVVEQSATLEQALRAKFDSW